MGSGSEPKLVAGADASYALRALNFRILKGLMIYSPEMPAVVSLCWRGLGEQARLGAFSTYNLLLLFPSTPSLPPQGVSQHGLPLQAFDQRKNQIPTESLRWPKGIDGALSAFLAATGI